MKTTSLILNISILAVLVMVLFRLRRIRSEAIQASQHYDDIDTLEMVEAPVIPLKALNTSLNLREGMQSSEVVALQMMLQYYNPAQAITGVLDANTNAMMRTITAETYKGDINLYTFMYSFFIPQIGSEAQKEIFSQFPNN